MSSSELAGSENPRTRRRFFAASTQTYAEAEFQTSEDAAFTREMIQESLATITRAFERIGYSSITSPEGSTDLSAVKLREYFQTAVSDGDVIVIYYTGHGESHEYDGYYLCTTDYERRLRPFTGIKASELPGLLARRDRSNDHGDLTENQPSTLFVMDCCFSATGGEELLRQQVVHGSGPGPNNLWVWATSSRIEESISGAFASALDYALTRPRDGASNPFLSIKEVVRDINDKLSDFDQAIHMYGPSGHFEEPDWFPNPRYIQGARRNTLQAISINQHWLDKARGGPHDRIVEGWYLSGRDGRSRAVSTLAKWVQAADPGRIAVVTGWPGSGKSTLLSLPVILNNKSARESLLADASRRSFAQIAARAFEFMRNDPLIDVHAHGKTIDQVAQEIDVGLFGSEENITTASKLISRLMGSVSPKSSRLIVLDALDESLNPDQILKEILIPLARSGHRVLLGSRRDAVQRLTEVPSEADVVIDLDDDQYRDQDAVVDYVAMLLNAEYEDLSTPYQGPYGLPHRDTQDVARAIAERAADEAGGRDSFVIAQIIALAVRARNQRIDLNSDVDDQLPGGLIDAFEEDLRRFTNRAGAARALLEALAWARWPGLPWSNVWLSVAQGIADLHSEPEYSITITEADIDAVRERASAYIVDDLSLSGMSSVFRPFHATLTEYLRALLAGSNEQARDKRSTRVEEVITHQLIATVQAHVGDAPRWGVANDYLRIHLAEHAYAAGIASFTRLIEDPGFLAVAAPSVLAPLLRQPTSALGDRALKLYRIALPLLGFDASANGAYLLEAEAVVAGTLVATSTESMHAKMLTAGIRPHFQVHLAATWTTDISILTAPIGIEIGAIAFIELPNGVVLIGVTRQFDAMLHLWDTATGAKYGTYSLNDPEYSLSARSADGSLVWLFEDNDKLTHIVDPSSGQIVGSGVIEVPHKPTNLAVDTTNGRCLLGLTSGSSVFVNDLARGHRHQRESSDEIISLCMIGSATGDNYIAAQTSRRELLIWNLHNGEEHHFSLRTWLSRILPKEPAAALTLTKWLYFLCFALAGALLGVPIGIGCVYIGRNWLEEVSLGLTVFGIVSLCFYRIERRLIPAMNRLLQRIASVGLSAKIVATDDTTKKAPLFGALSSINTLRIIGPISDDPPVRNFSAQTSTITSFALGQNDSGDVVLATGGVRGEVEFWNAASGVKAEGPCRAHARAVTDIVFGRAASGDTLLATASFDGTVKVWNLKDVLSFDADNVQQPERKTRSAAVLTDRPVLRHDSSEKNGLVFIGRDGALQSWNLANLGSTSISTPLTRILDWSPWSDMLLGRPYDQSLLICGGTNLEGDAQAAVISPDGCVRLLDLTRPRTISRWRRRKLRNAKAIALGGGATRDAVVAVATASRIYIHTADAGRSVMEIDVTGRAVVDLTITYCADGILCLAVTYREDVIALYDIQNGRKLGPERPHESVGVSPTAFSTGAQTIVATVRDHVKVALSDLTTGEVLSEPFIACRDGLSAMISWTTSAGRQRLLTGSYDPQVRLWDAETRQCLLVIDRRSAVSALAVYGPLITVVEEEGLSSFEMDASLL